MILIDRALESRERTGKPIRVGMIGAGFMGRGIARRLLATVPGMRLAAIANRNTASARQAFSGAGASDVVSVESRHELRRAIESDRAAVTEDAELLCEADGIDAIIEVTGAVEFGARVALRAIEHGKHVVLMNAELDGTLGPILNRYALRQGVVLTNADGDQPGVTMNLYRFVKGLGVTPVLCGNIKGLHDPYRNPTTQEGFARRWGQNPRMVTSFADGTKISFEQAVVANATRMRVARRGMHGPVVPAGTPVNEAASWYPTSDLEAGHGIVDYVVGASPGPGVFVLGTHQDPVHRHYLNLYKLGEGPFYCFYTPYHLCHFEIHNTVARAVLFADATIAPAGAPYVDVVTTAKIDLQPGHVLDGCGGYLAYGQAENSSTVRRDRLLPMGLSEGCRIVRPVARDQVITYADVVLPEGRLCDRLRAEQEAVFGGDDDGARGMTGLDRSRVSVAAAAST